MASQTHRSPAEELRHLEQIADAGDSNETPLIVGAGTFVALLVVFVAILGVAMLAYYLS